MNKQDIKSAREFWGLKKKEIAIITGIHPNTWYRYENEGVEGAERSNLNLVKMTMRPHSMKRLMDNASEYTVNRIGEKRYREVFQKVLGEAEKIDEQVNELHKKLNDGWVDSH